MNGTDPEGIKAGAMVVGSEILLGRTRDTNTIFLAENLLRRGIKLRKWVIIPDVMEQIGSELGFFIRDGYDIVVISGGLGPTHDDITVEAVAASLDLPVESDRGYYRRMVEKWGRRNPGRDIPESARMAFEKMSRIPPGFDLMDNEEGMADGLAGKIGRTRIFLLPGVPGEYKGIVTTERFQNYLPRGHDGDIRIIEIDFQGRESQIRTFLGELQERFPDIDIGSYPRGQRSVTLRVTGYPERVDKVVRMIREEVRRIGRQSGGTGSDS